MEYRIEKDLIGELPIPKDAYYGINTQRAINNFDISGKKIKDYPLLIKANAYVKWAAAITNFELGLLSEQVTDAMVFACKELIAGKYIDQFPSDMLQGGAGTSTNMNVNEVIANIALEKMGYSKGEYEHCSTHDHVNLSQSTNDAYPTAIKLAVLMYNEEVVNNMKGLATAFDEKGKEFHNVIMMGRTHLQDAVPMRLGQVFKAWAVTLNKEVDNLKSAASESLEINMGATAVGTGLNAKVGYQQLCTKNLTKVSGYPFVDATDLVEATSNTGCYVEYSSALKRVATKLSKICNDLRLLASGPRCGFHEINLPARQAGSSIMPGKVNPVMAEVISQTCFKIIGNDLTVTLAAEAGQLQLNVMEPVITYSLLESQHLLIQATKTLKDNCIIGITANVEHCKQMVLGSIGIVTALNPYIGYDKSTDVAMEALHSGRDISSIVLEQQLMSKEQLDIALSQASLLGEK